ncbi:MAG: hypothetical protein K2N42_06180, partial [Anaeroplasmataceae bacterium]|nr:hypothetical protein [Anaeroplasmataceae bacterium]
PSSPFKNLQMMFVKLIVDKPFLYLGIDLLGHFFFSYRNLYDIIIFVNKEIKIMILFLFNDGFL